MNTVIPSPEGCVAFHSSSHVPSAWHYIPLIIGVNIMNYFCCCCFYYFITWLLLCSPPCAGTLQPPASAQMTGTWLMSSSRRALLGSPFSGQSPRGPATVKMSRAVSRHRVQLGRTAPEPRATSAPCRQPQPHHGAVCSAPGSVLSC